MILSYQTIKHECIKGMLHPWKERTVSHGMTYGLGPAGYDIRVAQEIILFPNDFTLASSMERFHMPDDVLAQVCDKSTLARMGLFVQNTIIEPGWEGFLTLEITYHGNVELIVEKEQPIAQIVFFRLDQPTQHPYDGKYQNQERGVQVPILERGGNFPLTDRGGV